MFTNPFFIVILAALIAGVLLHLVSEILNLRALKPELPPGLDDVYKSEDYRNSQEYTRVNTRFALVVSAFRIVILLSFWFTGGFNYLDQMVRSWGFVTPVSGVLYIGIIFLGYSILTLPFNIYATFSIEERFGFNKTTPRTFMLDHIKALTLAVLLGVPLLACIISLFEYAGSYAWLYCWIIITVYSLVIEFVIPTWIMPLFNKFTPIESGSLKHAIMQYANSVNFPIKNIFVIDGSKRSSKSNAFFIGFGKNKRIALFDTLIERHTVPELVAVLAHEIGHYKYKHILQGIVIGILHTGVVLFLLSIFLSSPGLYHAFYMEQQSIYAGLLLFGLLYTPIELLLSIGMNILSRRNEYEADRFAAKTVDEPRSLIDTLKKLASDNLSNLTPHPFYVFLNYSHPPLLQRINAINRYR